MSGCVDGVRVPMSLEVLEAEICRRSANLTAAELEWLLLVAEFDDRQGWVGQGVVSCAHWLAWQVGLDVRAAREKVRVGHALLDVALLATSNQVERLCAAMRRREPEALDAERRAHAGRGVWVRADAAELELTVRVPAEAGKALLAAIDVFVSRDDLSVGLAARRADAVVAMAEHAVAHAEAAPGSGPRYLASIHVDDDVFDHGRWRDPGSVCCVSAGDSTGGDVAVGVAMATAKRMLCDAVLEGLLEGDGGQVIAVGRRSRVPDRRLRRLVVVRDGGCRVPGCDRKGWVDVHHIVHWVAGGPTVAENLVCVCRHHHRLLHEGGWRVTGDPRTHSLRFVRADGTDVEPPALTFGDADAVESHGRRAADGMCGWLGDPLDVDYTIDVVTDVVSGTTFAPRTKTPQGARGHP